MTINLDSTPLRYQHLKTWHHWVDILLAIDAVVLSVETEVSDDNSANPNLWAAARLLRVAQPMLHMPSVRIMLESMQIAFVNVASYMALWLITVFSFMIGGMSIFAGTVTKARSQGGPGYWAKSPWNSTQYGSDPYYYVLNFDSGLNAFFTLFVCTIQNNWHVVVNGFTEASRGAYICPYMVITVHIR